MKSTTDLDRYLFDGMCFNSLKMHKLIYGSELFQYKCS